MKLNVKHFGCAVATVWSLCVFAVGVGNLINSAYGGTLLKVLDSIFPGYHYLKWGFGGVIVATLYAALTSWIAGMVLAWLYNFYSEKCKKS